MKEFNDTSDFIKYYELNKTEQDNLSTCALNDKFKNVINIEERKDNENQLEHENNKQNSTNDDKLDINNMKID